MSIIYDALKKTQKAIDVSPKIESHKEPPVAPKDRRVQTKPKIKLYLLYVFTACLGLFIANIFFAFLRHPKVPAAQDQSRLSGSFKGPQADPATATLPQIPAPKPEAIQSAEKPLLSAPESKKEPPAALVLNGIFSSGDEGYCLINNQIAKAGDVIDGARVLRINSNDVELERDGLSIKLRTSSR